MSITNVILKVTQYLINVKSYRDKLFLCTVILCTKAFVFNKESVTEYRTISFFVHRSIYGSSYMNPLALKVNKQRLLMNKR